MISAIFVLDGDNVILEGFNEEARFIFTVVGSTIYYVDTSIGTMWRITVADLTSPNCPLGTEHRKLLKKHFNIA